MDKVIPLVNSDEMEALSEELSAAFEASASHPDDATLSRLMRHAEELGAPAPSRSFPLKWLALAALALLGLGLSMWSGEAPESEHLSLMDGVDDELVWHAEESSDGLDLLGLPLSSSDPERALEIVDALIAELDDV